MCKECLVVGHENFKHVDSRGGGAIREEEIFAQRRAENRVGDWCTFNRKLRAVSRILSFPWDRRLGLLISVRFVWGCKRSHKWMKWSL